VAGRWWANWRPHGVPPSFLGCGGWQASSAIVGPLSYGLITYLTAGNQRLAILPTVLFFVAGLMLLATMNESRGKAAAMEG
jgi:MFS transporter, UMF1 family